MFFIKLKVKGYLKNLTENTEDLIDTKAIKNSNIISYIIDDTKYKIIIDKNKITLLRENNEFTHGMLFEENKTNKSEYYLKESNYSLEFNILTEKLIIDKNKIDITYKIIESNNIYNYVLESSDNL
ncbi:MAG: hypothetical protein IJE89_05255 [Bacilli bacterium]|nr:hypothetical protein [Bacilli bacterium]